MSDSTNPQDAAPDNLQAALLNSGAQAQEIDVNALLAQMNALQAQVDKLNAEKGIPADPIAANKDNLLAHVEARAAQYPDTDFSHVVKAIKELPDSAAITAAHTGRIHEMVSDMVESLPRHELSYVKTLARTLHLGILDKTVAAIV